MQKSVDIFCQQWVNSSTAYFPICNFRLISFSLPYYLVLNTRFHLINNYITIISTIIFPIFSITQLYILSSFPYSYIQHNFHIILLPFLLYNSSGISFLSFPYPSIPSLFIWYTSFPTISLYFYPYFFHIFQYLQYPYTFYPHFIISSIRHNIPTISLFYYGLYTLFFLIPSTY
jgi:hypothetical protein